ncbi:hypothetical protein [Burkholderia cepacia]|uniref:hypothetical protein n=1 Tax=Burkholderia cepacia TaxID=292 RepID=UPI001D001DFB|nr:hypothetical protein [Burkholderia cepacia]
MEGTIARSVGSLRANGLAARPRGEGAHFTGSGGTNRKKWRKREQGKEARPANGPGRCVRNNVRNNEITECKPDVQADAQSGARCGARGGCGMTSG